MLLQLAFISEDEFDIMVFKDYQKMYESEELKVCSNSKTKTYMDYRAITDKSSTQYRFIREKMKVDKKTGFLSDEDGFIGVALGSFYGIIGDRFYITLDSGVILPIIKIEEKADIDTGFGCYHLSDGSVIEFVIDKNYAADYFGIYGNGLILSGNYNNHELFKGEIYKVEKVLDSKKTDYVTYILNDQNFFDYDIFYYASGY